MAKSGMSWREKGWRERLARLAREDGVLRGTIAVRWRVCGKAGCRCARGAKHQAMYVVYREGGRVTQVYVPHAWEERARRWVKRYLEARELLEKLSSLYEGRVRRRRA